MTSLKSLNSIALTFALDSKVAGLSIIRHLTGPKLAASNPECKVSYTVRN